LSWESLIVIDLSEFGQLLLHALKQTLLGFIMLLVMEMDVQVAGIRQVSRTFGSCNHSEFQIITDGYFTVVPSADI